MSEANNAHGGQESLLRCPACESLVTATDRVEGALGLCPVCKSLLQVPPLGPPEQRKAAVRRWLAHAVDVRTLTGHVLEGLTVGQALGLLSEGRLAPSDMVRASGHGQFHPLHSDEHIGPIHWDAGPCAHLDRIGVMLAAGPANLLHDARSGLSFVGSVPQGPRIHLREVGPENVAPDYQNDARALIAEREPYRWPTGVSDPRAALLQADPVTLRMDREAASGLDSGETTDPLQTDAEAWTPGPPSDQSAVQFQTPEPVKEDQELLIEPEPVDELISPAALADMLPYTPEAPLDEEGHSDKEGDMLPTQTIAGESNIISFDDFVPEPREPEPEPPPPSVPKARLVKPSEPGESIAELGEADLVEEDDDADDKAPPASPRSPKKR